MKILWMSRHKPLVSQLTELRRLFGEDVVVKQDEQSFDAAEDIVRQYNANGYDEVVVVAPLSVLASLVRLGLHPLVAEMRRGDVSKGEEKGRYEFIEFRRIERLELVTSIVQPVINPN